MYYKQKQWNKNIPDNTEIALKENTLSHIITAIATRNSMLINTLYCYWKYPCNDVLETNKKFFWRLFVVKNEKLQLI